MLLLASILTLLLFKLISALISVSTLKDFVFFCLFFFMSLSSYLQKVE